VTGAVTSSYLNEWLSLAARWAHIVIAMTWIGTSIYFMRFDMMLRAPPPNADGVVGEQWSVHSGGVYHSTKYRVAPQNAAKDPDYATPWPAWATWITGFLLMILVYYWNADSYLIDRSVADLSQASAIAISVGILVAGWLAYDAACRSIRDDRLVTAIVVALTVATAWGTSRLFAPRAAWLETGAVLGTIMSANVLFVINPANRRVAGAHERTERDAVLGADAKRRSIQNSYLTLPVVLAMIATHFPSGYGNRWSWEILLALMALGASVRHFFIQWHAGRRLYAIPAVAAAAFVALLVAVSPDRAPARSAHASVKQLTAGRALFQAVGCASCHTLGSAGSTGTVGPNLDAAKPSRDVVIDRVTNGLGGMPSFGERLSSAQIAAIALYVSSAAGRR
jgi:uncharacterized membrane protein